MRRIYKIGINCKPRYSSRFPFNIRPITTSHKITDNKNEINNNTKIVSNIQKFLDTTNLVINTTKNGIKTWLFGIFLVTIALPIYRFKKYIDSMKLDKINKSNEILDDIFKVDEKKKENVTRGLILLVLFWPIMIPLFIWCFILEMLKEDENDLD